MTITEAHERAEKQFPVLGTKGKQTVPWSFIEEGRQQAMRNHYQTLERLAERGGLSWVEIWYVMMKKEWKGLKSEIATEEAEPIVRAMIAARPRVTP